MKKLKLVIRNTHFVVTPLTDDHKLKSLITSFSNNLITYKMIYNPHLKKMKRVEDRRYYYPVHGSIHFSIQIMGTFVKRVLNSGYCKDDFDIHYDTEYAPGILGSELNEELSDRPHQTMYIDKVLATGPYTLVDLPTGKGKTYISMRVATKLKAPTGVMVLSRYIEKWESDIKELTTATDEDMYVVKGRGSLIKLLNSSESYDFVIFSLSTVRSYIKAYDEGDVDCCVAPEDIFKKLGLVMLLHDEVHQSFHAGYMTAIRLNPIKVVSLSATLDNLDANIKTMYYTLYPNEARCGTLVRFRPHNDVIAVNYAINTNRIICKGPRGYSHTLFEQSVLRDNALRNNYLKLVLHYANKGYVRRRESGNKLLILVQTKKMANLLTWHLRGKLKGLVVNRYVEEDPYDNIMEADVTVSTNLSAGTALDIPGLITTIQMVSMASLQANVQALGRLREIKGVATRYYYIYSSSLPDQQRLHLIRRDVIRKLAKSYSFEEFSLCS